MYAFDQSIECFNSNWKDLADFENTTKPMRIPI
jgi:hypothetical protein